MGEKWNDAKPGEKMLALYTMLLVNTRAMSLKEIADKLECSKQTALRLLNQMESSQYGKLMQEKRDRQSYYRLEKPKRPSAVSLNAEGLAQIAQWRELMLRLLPEGMRNLGGANLDDERGRLDQIHTSTVGQSLSKGKIDYAPFESILDTLLAAISEGKVCQVAYRAQRNQPEKNYCFAPKRLLAYHEALYILGYMVTDEDPATLVYDNRLQLALQRFTSCQVTERKAHHIPDPEIAEKALGIMGGSPFEVVVQFEPSAATYAAERTWSEGQKLEELEDGSIILRVTVQNKPECIAWVLGFGPEAHVLEPEWLRKEVMEKIDDMRKRYG